jgi:hypothetical protein
MNRFGAKKYELGTQTIVHPEVDLLPLSSSMGRSMISWMSVNESI